MGGRPMIPLSLSLSLPLPLPLALALGACFSESPPAGEEGTTGEPCTPQTLGCPCEAGACASGLSCEPSVELCIDPSCTPGTELCTCAEGSACLAGLSCEGGLCRPPRPPPGGDTTAGAVTSGATTSPGDDLTTLPGEADVTTVADTLDPLTTSLTATITDDGDPTMPPTCGTSPCGECYACQTQNGGMCAAQFTACQASDECLLRASCTLECAENDAECVQSCCAKGMLGSIPYEALANCLEDACTNCGQDLNCGV